jgi:putative hydrolase of the HAD superfamily
MIRVVIFDLDNTLVDFFRMKDEAVKAATAAMIDAGLDMDFISTRNGIKEVYKQKGIEYQEVFDQFLTEKLGYIDHKILASAVVAYRRSREGTLVLYPHVTATLSKLAKRGIRLALITDAPPKQAWLRLCYLHQQHLFDIVVTPEDTGATKPSPKPFQLVMNKLNITPAEALMVGDWPDRDMVGGSNVGIRTVYAKYGGRKLDKESGADFEIDDVSELVSIIDDLNLPS